MKCRLLVSVITVILGMMFVHPVKGQQAATDRLSVAFSDPSRPGLLQVEIMTGSVTIKGYSGKEVVIASQSLATSRSRPTPPEANGLRRIEVSGSELTIQEHNNIIEIESRQVFQTTGLEIEVPSKTNLKVSTMFGSKISVEDVEGDIELGNLNGDVSAINVAGSVVAHSTNGNVIAVFRQITPQKSMSFVSMNGKIDVTLPESTKANLKMRTDNGDLYTDFDVQLGPTTQSDVRDNRNRGGRYRVEIGKSVSGSINGGGPDYEFRTFNGNVYLRKGSK